MSLQYLKLILLITITTNAVAAQIGKHCESEYQCTDEQICVSNLCVCKFNHIAKGIHCFREANFGEVCWFNEQCTDHRLICANTSVGIQRCICDMYHQYDYNVSECVLKANITDLLQERYDIHSQIVEGARSTFHGILITGLVVTGIGFSCMIIAIIYCFRMHISDTKLNRQVTILTNSVGKKPQASVKRSSEDTKKMNDAAIGPIFSDDLVIG
ncbi:uncharacterized protein LOC143920562 [Arctopsyche grandis]|uniref:uncharacterized protein LOC143920562 n=1 Tax=Arctopsyche grandis TaxID=121162 RepID=UPI00406D63F3